MLPDQPIADERLKRLAGQLAERYGGRAVTASYIVGEKPYWRVDVLPLDSTIARRLKVDLAKLSPADQARFEHEPVATGIGPTQAEAFNTIRPVPWTLK